MAVKKNGISPDLLIHPGETVYDLLEDRGITQKELAQRTGVSEAFLSDVINGKKDISKGLAMGLEYATGVPASFWLNLQANYDAELLSLQEKETVEEEEKTVLESIREIVGFLEKTSVISKESAPEEKIIQLRKYFQISSLKGLRSLAPAGAFRISEHVSINPDVFGAWLCLCKVQRSERQLATEFECERVNELISEIKMIMLNDKCDIEKSLTELLAQYGINFSIVHNFRGAPVQGYISRNHTGTYQMVLTLRGSFADIFWFSLFHELGHIVNGDIVKTGSYVDLQNPEDQRKETAADEFARHALLEQKSYNRFVAEGEYSYNSIKEYAQTQNVPSYIVIGRLQKDEIIPWEKYSKYKPRYKWAEL